MWGRSVARGDLKARQLQLHARLLCSPEVLRHNQGVRHCNPLTGLEAEGHTREVLHSQEELLHSPERLHSRGEPHHQEPDRTSCRV